MHLSFYLIMPTIPRYFSFLLKFLFSRLMFTHERVERGGAGGGQRSRFRAIKWSKMNNGENNKRD